MIGNTVWRFDENYREYERDANGRAIGVPIYRMYWRPIQVFGETSRSWLAGPTRKPYKIPKSGPHRGFALSAEEVEEDCWANDARLRIRREMDRYIDRADVPTLRKLAELIGWNPKVEA